MTPRPLRHRRILAIRGLPAGPLRTFLGMAALMVVACVVVAVVAVAACVDTVRAPYTGPRGAAFPHSLTAVTSWRPGFWESTIRIPGAGSVRLAIPPDFAMSWQAGGAVDGLSAAPGAADRPWASALQERVRDPGGPVRVMLTNGWHTDNDGISVTVLARGDTVKTGDELARTQRRLYQRAGFLVFAGYGVQVNGRSGAYTEVATGQRPLCGFGMFRVIVQVLIPDPPDQLTWGVLCDGPDTTPEEVRHDCAQLAANLQPLSGASE
jgi:hypothetical protein